MRSVKGEVIQSVNLGLTWLVGSRCNDPPKVGNGCYVGSVILKWKMTHQTAIAGDDLYDDNKLWYNKPEIHIVS